MHISSAPPLSMNIVYILSMNIVYILSMNIVYILSMNIVYILSMNIFYICFILHHQMYISLSESVIDTLFIVCFSVPVFYYFFF
jgi:hypothetical protein